MAALFDTTVAVVLLRKKLREDASALIAAARREVASGSALLPAVALSELMIGERTQEGRERLAAALAKLPTVVLTAEAASLAGTMGSFLAARGQAIPLPDLLIAGTAVWLDVPLLTWDADYARARTEALRSREEHPGARFWRSLQLHSDSRSDD